MLLVQLPALTRREETHHAPAKSRFQRGGEIKLVAFHPIRAFPHGGGNFAELVALPLGALDDPYFDCIDYSVWERRKHAWVQLIGEEIEHRD